MNKVHCRFEFDNGFIHTVFEFDNALYSYCFEFDNGFIHTVLSLTMALFILFPLSNSKQYE
jgi:hypothetical protein